MAKIGGQQPTVINTGDSLTGVPKSGGNTGRINGNKVASLNPDPTQGLKKPDISLHKNDAKSSTSVRERRIRQAAGDTPSIGKFQTRKQKALKQAKKAIVAAKKGLKTIKKIKAIINNKSDEIKSRKADYNAKVWSKLNKAGEAIRNKVQPLAGQLKSRTYGDAKRALLKENWRPASSELINSSSPVLRELLNEYNEKLSDLSQLKEEAKTQRSQDEKLIKIFEQENAGFLKDLAKKSSPESKHFQKDKSELDKALINTEQYKKYQDALNRKPNTEIKATKEDIKFLFKEIIQQSEKEVAQGIEPESEKIADDVSQSNTKDELIKKRGVLHNEQQKFKDSIDIFEDSLYLANNELTDLLKRADEADSDEEIKQTQYWIDFTKNEISGINTVLESLHEDLIQSESKINLIDKEFRSIEDREALLPQTGKELKTQLRGRKN